MGYSGCILFICSSSLPSGPISPPPHSPDEVVNYGGLLFHPSGGHVSKAGQSPPWDFNEELMRPTYGRKGSQEMEASSFEPLDPAMIQGRYIL